MSKAKVLFFVLAIIVCVSAMLIAQGKPRDPFGRVDKVDVVVSQVKANHYAVELNWENDQKLTAFAFPLVVRGKGFHMHYDSVKWSERTEYFAVKSVRPLDSLQQVLVGFFATLGDAKPPLTESKGRLATLFFTAEGAKGATDVCAVTVDTTFIPPSNTLFGVTPDGSGNVLPAFSVSKTAADGKPAACK